MRSNTLVDIVLLEPLHYQLSWTIVAENVSQPRAVGCVRGVAAEKERGVFGPYDSVYITAFSCILYLRLQVRLRLRAIPPVRLASRILITLNSWY